MVRLRLLIVIAAVLIAVASVNAQVASRVTGSVVDASGAGVPDATVSLQLPGSGSSVYTAKTTSAGDFNLLSVNPATYDLVVEAKGFLKAVVSGLEVAPSRTRDVPAIKLEVAGITQTVEVTSATQSVQTSNAEVTTTIVKSQIQNLPVIDRSPLAFLRTQPGINYSRGSTTVNGQRPTYVAVTMDGINIQDNYIRTNDVDFLPNLVLLDQVAEVSVSTSNASAAISGGSAQIQFVTPSGTNQFHGNAYWSNRNRNFSANTWFNNQAGTPRPFLNQNQIGGSLGGPVIKNKVFFYSNYEAFRLRQQSSQNKTILTADARNGIYTYLVGGAPQKVNILQAMGIQADPAAAAILAQVPDAGKINNYNVGDSTNSLLRNTAGYQMLRRNNRTRDNLTLKGDYLASTKNVFSVSYIWNRDILDRPDQDATYVLVPMQANNDVTKLLSSAWRWSPKPNLTNEARFGFNWAPAIFLDSQEIPKYFVSGTTYTNPAGQVLRTQGRNTDTWSFADNASWVHGAHTVQFGFQAQWTKVESYNDAGITPSYGLGIGVGNTGLAAAQLPGISASDLSAANTLLATLGGYVTSYTQTFNVSSRTSGYVNGYTNLRHDILNNYAFYGQDSWKLARHVTATFGLRWDYYAPVDERDSLQLMPLLQNGNVIQTVMNPNAALDFAGGSAGRPWYKSDKNNFAPNVGLAWDIFGDGKMALRAGYSFSYVNDNLIRAAENSLGTNAGLQSTSTKSALSGRLSAGVPAVTVPTYKVPRTLADNYVTNSQAAVAMPGPDLVTPYVQQWNIGIQRSVKNTMVEVRYVGNHATKAIRGFDYNQVLISAMLPDFLKALNNGLLAQRAGGSFVPAYNAAIAGSQPLPFFAQLPSGGNLSNSTVISNIQTGQVGELGSFYQTSLINGPVNFFTNPNVLGANVLTNYTNSSYNALALEVNHRFAHGFQFQGNYVYSKVMSDSAGNGQTNFEAFLDNNNAKIERARVADYDITHVIKANGVYELPFGPGKRFSSSNGVLSRVIGGWRMAAIVTEQSGSPFSILSTRGTVNRAGRSGLNTAVTPLKKAELDQIFQFRMTPTGPMFVPDSVKGSDGRAVAADGAAPFTGQVFYQPAAGTLGTLQRNYFSGPWVFDMDAQIAKVTKINERHSIELRMDSSNIFNHPTFYVGDQTITSTTFGKITSNYFGRRLIQFALYYRF